MKMAVAPMLSLRAVAPVFARVCAVASALIVLTTTTPHAALAQRNPVDASSDSLPINSLEFDGPRVISDAILRTAIVSTQTSCINPALEPLCFFGIGLDKQYVDARVLAADVVRLRLFYYQHGYRQAAVVLDTTRTDDGMDVRFHIDAGVPVVATTVDFAGADSVAVDVSGLPLRPGMPLSLIDYELTRDSLAERLANRGYAHAYVLANYEIPRDSAFIAHVRFEVAPGARARFGDIEVQGAVRVSPSVVRRMLLFKPGDRYSESALLKSQRSLFSLEIFRHAEIDTIASATDTLVPIRVSVNEGDLHRFRVGVGTNTAEYLNAEGRWTSRNFLGGARHLEVRGRITNLASVPLKYVPFFDGCHDIYCRISGSLSADLEQPWFWGSRNTLGLGAFAERLTLPDVYVRTSRGASISLRRALGGGGAAQLAYRPELTRLESEGDVIFCVNFVACDPADIAQLRASHWLAPVALSYAVDQSNNIFNPTRGLVFRADAELAAPATGSDFAYGRVLGELTGYHEIARDFVLAARLRPGVARAMDKEGDALGLHPQKRFFAGGPSSVRGYAQYRLGPKLLTIDAARSLTDSVSHRAPVCTPQQVNNGTCDVTSLVGTNSDLFVVRPIGGAALVEGNVELRFPVLGGLRGAAFLDFGQVWNTAKEARLRDLAWSPGLGIRYFSPIGPIRVDVGYNTRGAEQITVVTTRVCNQVSRDVCEPIADGQSYSPDKLENTRVLQPLGTVTWNPYNSFISRLQFHFSIGQAF
jgi:outer membrane protein assembly factor BamA